MNLHRRIEIFLQLRYRIRIRNLLLLRKHPFLFLLDLNLELLLLLSNQKRSHHLNHLRIDLFLLLVIDRQANISSNDVVQSILSLPLSLQELDPPTKEIPPLDNQESFQIQLLKDNQLMDLLDLLSLKPKLLLKKCQNMLVMKRERD